MTIHSLDDAMKFFLANSSGGVTCKSGDASLYCECYPDAQLFYRTIEDKQKALLAQNNSSTDPTQRPS